MRRSTVTALSVALAMGAAACSDKNPSAPVGETISTPPPGMVVSNVQASSVAGSSVSASSVALRSSLSVAASTLAYVSAVPGTFPGATSATVRNQTRGSASQSIEMIDGGFDPVGIDAAAGDVLSFTGLMTGGGLTPLSFKVPPRRPPGVVRTNPTKGRTDVALNVLIVAVFSEPIDRSSVTSSSVALLQGGNAVNGRLQVSADGLRAEFIPDGPLLAGTTYALVIGAGVHDLDGDALGQNSIVTFTTASDADGPSSSGSISGMILNENGEVLSDTVLVWVVAVATAPYQRLSFIQFDRTKEFNLQSLRPGQWTLTFTGIHAWTAIFPELQLYPDTSVVVQVVEGEETVIPAVKLRPREPLLLVGLETCPWALPDPPSVDDWWQCDGGYWGGAAALITVTGVAGTGTAEFRSTGAIGPANYAAPPTRWDTTPWSTHFDINIAGDYDVTIALTPDPLRPTWRLVPWQTMTTRVTVGRGLSYVEFDFWYK